MITAPGLAVLRTFVNIVRDIFFAHNLLKSRQKFVREACLLLRRLLGRGFLRRRCLACCQPSAATIAVRLHGKRHGRCSSRSCCEAVRRDQGLERRRMLVLVLVLRRKPGGRECTCRLLEWPPFVSAAQHQQPRTRHGQHPCCPRAGHETRSVGSGGGGAAWLLVMTFRNRQQSWGDVLGLPVGVCVVVTGTRVSSGATRGPCPCACARGMGFVGLPWRIKGKKDGGITIISDRCCPRDPSHSHRTKAQTMHSPRHSLTLPSQPKQACPPPPPPPPPTMLRGRWS